MKVTTILSGGMDSTTLLYKAIQEFGEGNVFALSFNYGQKHKKELDFAIKLCKELRVNHKVIDISVVQELLSASSLTSEQDVPEGHYAEENMKQTVVPNRNAIMLSIAYGYAITNKSSVLFYGAHAGDHFIYPDCRLEFVKALDSALFLGNLGFGDVSIVAPYARMSKADIVKDGLSREVPYEKTWSCYKGLDRPCGKCGTCVERTEAFLENNVEDPAMTTEEWTEAVKYYEGVKK